jgi:4-hydroxybenzoate polyprenyltransferase
MTAPLVSRRFVRAYAITMRPYLLFVSGVTGIAGLAAAGPAPAGVTLVLAAVLFLGYGFGQALTDCFQTDTDAISSPYRPLVRGEVRRRDVLTVSLLGLAASGVVVAVRNPWNLPLAALAVVGLWQYTWFKRRWWGGPFWNAWIVALLALVGFLAQSGRATSPADMPLALRWILVGAFFGYANFVLTGYYKDVSADRATGYRTLPVVFGHSLSAVVSDAFATLAMFGWIGAICASRAGLGDGFPAATWAFGLAGAAFVVAGQILQHRIRAESDAHRAIVPVVHGYVLWSSAVIAALRPSWTLPLAVGYAAFILAMRLRPERSQV